MHFFVSLALFGLIALIVYNVYVYKTTTGSVADRLSAGFKGSMTIFSLIWATILGWIVSGLDVLSQITGDPQFTTAADAIKKTIPEHWGPYLTALVLLLPLVAGVLGRNRTLSK